MELNQSHVTKVLSSQAAKAQRWLFDSALPLWHENSLDRAGSFVEKLALTGEPDETTRRARVTARQVYSFALGGKLGWTGPVAEIVRHGLDGLLGPMRRPDGMIVHLIHPDGRISDPGPDLYDQAFFLLALASAHPLLPDLRLDREAENLIDELKTRFAHSGGGFEDALPPRRPLRSNPHMHMFEAALAWMEAAPSETWRGLANDVATLLRTRFLDPETGALLEFFESGWTPIPAAEQILEPGHHFEWAWLLLRWGALSGEDTRAIASRLFDIAESHGVDPARGVAFDEMNADFSPKTTTARLWPQTERLKASLALIRASSSNEEKDRALSAALSACAALERYLDTPTNGLWRDRMRADGSFVEEAAPASSFYHIVCAYSELIGHAANPP